MLFKALSTRERDVDDAAAVLRRLAERIDHDVIRGELGPLAREIDVEARFAVIEERSRGRSER